jgi:hypothetical protein
MGTQPMPCSWVVPKMLCRKGAYTMKSMVPMEMHTPQAVMGLRSRPCLKMEACSRQRNGALSSQQSQQDRSRARPKP